MAQIVLGALDLAPCLIPSGLRHQRCGPRKPTPGPARDRQHHLQITQQVRRRWRMWLDLPLRFEKQQRLLQNPLPHRRQSAAPGGVELARLPAVEPVRGKRFGHPLAVLDIGAGDRHQHLHRHMGRDLAAAHFLLNRLGKQFHQRQSARHPADATVEPACQLIEAVTEARFQFRKQPALFERGLAFGETHRTIQYQGLGFAHRPDHRFHRVSAQFLQSRYPLEAVDNPIAIGLVRNRDHHDRRLLARGGQRSQQTPLPLGTVNPQMLVATIELVKLQLHPILSLPHLRPLLCGNPRLVLPGWREKWVRNPRRINNISLKLVLRGTQQ